MARPKKIEKLTDLRPQVNNANRHTQRGLGLLEDSIARDGWIGAVTVAADGETFDGSARLETGVASGFDDAIVVESDGSRPVIVKRTDIKTANDPKAKRLGVAANQIARVDYDPDAEILRALAADDLQIAEMWTPEDWEALIGDVPDFGASDAESQDRLDEKTRVCCPSCGHEFTP